MAEQNTPNASNFKVITTSVNIRSNDRSKKDVKTWRNAHISAESITLPQRVSLYNVYADILLDGHLFGIVRKRIDTVLNKRLCFRIGEKPVEQMEKLTNTKVFRSIIEEILMSKMWGISGLEFIPGTKLAFNKIPRKHIKPHKKLISIEQIGDFGPSYDGVPNLWIIGEPDDLGLLLPCGFYALLKKGTITDWAEYIELFGSPLVAMYYDAGDRQTELALDKVLDTMGNSTRIKLPNQAKLDVKDGKSSNGNGDLQNQFRKAMNEEMSIVILGNTETTASSSSSGYAQSQTHSEQQLEIIKSDMLDVVDYLNSEQFMAILRSYGYPVDGGSFEYDREIDINYMAAKIKIDKELAAMGLPMSSEYLYETYAVDKPAENSNLLSASAKNAQTDKPAPQLPAENLSDDVMVSLSNQEDKPITREELRQMFSDFFGQAL